MSSDEFYGCEIFDSDESQQESTRVSPQSNIIYPCLFPQTFKALFTSNSSIDGTDLYQF